jgi:hypothetical protein
MLWGRSRWRVLQVQHRGWYPMKTSRDEQVSMDGGGGGGGKKEHMPKPGIDRCDLGPLPLKCGRGVMAIA